MGQNKLFDYMRRHGYLHMRGTRRNEPTQRSIEAGWMTIKEGTRTDSKGVDYVTKTPKVTGKGQIYFVNLFIELSAGNAEAGDRSGANGPVPEAGDTKTEAEALSSEQGQPPVTVMEEQKNIH
jgi:hypothetical protein